MPDDYVFPSTPSEKVIHTSSGSQLTYDKLAKERPMNDRKETEERMELPKALKLEITGYRKLNEEETTLINLRKNEAIQVGEIITNLETRTDIDKRWLAIAKTDLQKGFMALVRSIAKPETF